MGTKFRFTIIAARWAVFGFAVALILFGILLYWMESCLGGWAWDTGWCPDRAEMQPVAYAMAIFLVGSIGVVIVGALADLARWSFTPRVSR
jgi:hypothetical protein